MKRVLVTGSTGFLGSHLSRQLIRDGFQVAILIRPEAQSRRIADLLPHVCTISADLRKLQPAAQAIKDFAPEVVFHLAWYGVGNKYRNDTRQIAENLDASLELLHRVREAGCRIWIGLGSQAEYGVHDRVISEDIPTRPTTLYGATKLAACLLSQQLCRTYDMRFVWLRLFSCYGPDDNAGWLIPSVIVTLLRGKRPSLTQGSQRWDYLYVGDAARALIEAARSEQCDGIFNLASGQAYAIRTIVEWIRDLIDPSLPLGFGELDYRIDQIMHLQGDIRRLCEVTGWSPHCDLSTGLKHTVDWFRCHHSLYCNA